MIAEVKSLSSLPSATAAARRDVVLTLDALGTVQALNSVVVRPQVEGVLLETPGIRLEAPAARRIHSLRDLIPLL